jgi:pimeloyl-ACP methyl ester carboxylesterase
MPVISDLMAYVTPRSLIADGLRSSVAHPAQVTEADIDRYWELLRYPGNRTATIMRFGTPRDEPVMTPLPRPIPTLIMWGAEDKLIPVASAAWFKQKSPGAQVVIYPGVGHLMMEEIPDKSANDLKLWLAKLPATR